MTEAKADIWNALIYGHLASESTLLSKVRRVKRRSRAVALLIDRLMTVRNRLGLASVIRFGEHDQVCRWMAELLKRSRSVAEELERKPKLGKVYFAHMRGSLYLELFEIFLAHRLRFDGVASEFLVCDGLPVCNNYSLGEDRARYPTICNGCTRRQVQLLQASGLPYRCVTSSWDQRAEAERRTRQWSVAECVTAVYRGVPVGSLSAPSVARHMRKSAHFAEEPEEMRTWRSYLAAAMLLVDRYTMWIEECRPETVVMPGGFFMWYSVLSEMLKHRGIRQVIYETALHDYPIGNRWVFSDGVPLTEPQWISQAWQDWRSVPLTDAEEQRLLTIIGGRRQGTLTHPAPVSDEASVRRGLDLPDDGRPIVTLFTGLTWDYAIYGKGPGAFGDMLEWVCETIRFVDGRDIWLVVRIHPAEAILHEGVYGREKIADLVMQRLGALPQNVRIVPAESNLSSYRLVEMADAVCVFASTIGLETAVVGDKPVILASYSILSERGFGYGPQTPNDYFSLLVDPRRLGRPTPQMTAMARRFAFLYLFRTSWPIQFFESGGRGLYSIDRLTVKSLEELRPGRNRHLDHISRFLVHGGPVAMDRPLLQALSP